MGRITTAIAGMLICAAAMAQAEVALDPGLPLYVPHERAAGELTCAGGETMQPLVLRWATEFRRLHPRAMIRLAELGPLSADGFAALLEGKVDCVTFVREPFPAECAAYVARFGSAPLVVNVAGGSFDTRGGTHALAVFVNADNPLERMTLAQLANALGQAPGHTSAAPAQTWGELGTVGAWKSRPVHVYGMLRSRPTGNPPGIMNFLQQRVLNGGVFRTDLREQTDQPGETALDAIVNRVAADPDGIGVSGFTFARPGTKTLALATGAGEKYFQGSPDEVALRQYPLSRELYLLLKSRPREPDASLDREFLRFALSRDGQRLVGQDRMAFLPLRAQQARASLAIVEQAIPHAD
jgi:phosphate transport system substrate-binding protein